MRKTIEYPNPVIITVAVRENSKDMTSKVLGEIIHTDVISVEEVSDEDAEEYEEDFLDDEVHTDRYGEYLVLHFTFGADVIYRLSDVDWDISAM